MKLTIKQWKQNRYGPEDVVSGELEGVLVNNAIIISSLSVHRLLF